jgi:high-affinity nickel-transport protein
MITFLSILAVGFFLGMRHATDPDHVIAVTTIVSHQRTSTRAALIGVFWGVGHTLTIFVVGAGIILFNLVIPVRLGLSMELSVAVMLIVLGLMNVAVFLRSMPGAGTDGHGDRAVHAHPHSHGDFIHNHPHAHQPEAHPHSPDQTPLARLDRWFGSAGFYQYLRPLVVGIVHGLAGSAAVALLVLTTIRDSGWAIAYLLVFGVGTIAGMMLITMGIASTFRVMAGRRQSVTRNLSMASGLLSMAFGMFVAYQICVVNGIFAANPHWTPQ